MTPGRGTRLRTAVTSFGSAAVVVVSRIAFAACAGVALNWAFLFVAARELGASEDAIAMPGVAMLLFGLGFPLLYLLVGQRIGAATAIRRLYAAIRGDLHRGIVDGLAREPAIAASTSPESLARTIEDVYDRARLPRLVRRAANAAITRTPLGELSERLGHEPDPERRRTIVANAICSAIEAAVPSDGTGWFWILFAANVLGLAVATVVVFP